ncbi:hypothetical protein [Vibrio brasiliensis]
MNFGHVLTTLCSLVALSCSFAYAEIEIPDNLSLNTVESRIAYVNYIVKFRECNDKKLRKNNPYPINDWLISLPKEKQNSVLVYLHNLTSYNCVLGEQNKLIQTLEHNEESRALAVLEQEGWSEAPVYGHSALKHKKKFEGIKLTKEDEQALKRLVERNYLPFDGIGMGELLIKLRSADD